MSNETSLGNLVDSTEEEFRDFCSTLSIGYVYSLENLMTKTYNEVRDIKDDLIASVKSGAVKDDDHTRSVLNGMYSKLLRLERNVFILRERKKELALEPPIKEV